MSCSEPASKGDGGAGGDAAAGADAGGSDTGGSGDGGPEAGPATCSGQEPCGVYPVVVPAGYTIAPAPQLTVFNQVTDTSCTSFSDCDMWNTHFTKNYTDTSGNPVDPYYNRLGSPFPWTLSRYQIRVSPKTVEYVKFHVVAPGELYRYSDDTPVSRTDRSSGVATCFKRGPGHLVSALINNLGGTGNVGSVFWNISVLPGDMGDNVPGGTGSLNASTCKGSGISQRPVTADPATAATNPAYCLLQEGQDYYVNFLSAGKTLKIDCSTSVCQMGGFVLANPTTSDGSPLVVETPCP